MNKYKKIYIGIDPDLRLLNCAIVSDTKELLAVFIRRNKDGVDDKAVANAARASCRLVEDVIAFIVANIQTQEIITVVESQNMQHALRSRQQGRHAIVPDDIRRLSQVAGCLMGAFSNLSNRLILVQPNDWKGQVPKDIHHRRIYGRLGIYRDIKGLAKNLYPETVHDGYLIEWSKDKINPGDFADINDSIGLALYGLEKQF